MSNELTILESGEFIRRSLSIHKGVNTVETASEKAIALAQDITNVINKYEVNYLDINQAVILVDNGFYQKMLNTELDCLSEEKHSLE